MDTVEKALEFIPAVVGKVACTGSWPASWGERWKVERIKTMLRKARGDQEEVSQELCTIVLEYYDRPDRVAVLQEWIDNAPPHNSDALGPSLAVTAINAALSAKRPAEDEPGHVSYDWNISDDATLKDLMALPEPELGFQPIEHDGAFGRVWQELSDKERQAISAYLEHLEYPNQWDLVADALGVKAKQAHHRRQNAKRRVKTALGRIQALLAVELEDELLAAGMVTYDDTPAKKDGWRNVKCPFHEDNRRKNAGWHRSGLFRCWVSHCPAYVPDGWPPFSILRLEVENLL